MKLRVVALLSSLALSLWPAGPAAAQGGPIMPLSQVVPGMNCTGYTVIHGTTISSFNVLVIAVADAQAPGGVPGILIQVSGPAVAATGIAEGFSGSPVLCPGPGGTMETAGAISASVGSSDNSLGIATPIEAMLGEPVLPPPSAIHLKLQARELAGPLMVTGLAPAILGLTQRIAKRFGRSLVGAPVGSAPAYPVQPLVPGASVAVGYATGAVGMGAIGTVTYVDGNNIYGFGHPLDAAGRRSLFLQDAYVYGVVPATFIPLFSPGSYKLASPGHVEGTLTADTPNAVIGVPGAAPPSVPVDVTARNVDTGQTISLQSQVADETGVGLPLGVSLVDLAAPAEAGQAALDVYASGAPADESGSMCFSVYLRETRTPLKFCNRYVGTGGTGSPNFIPLPPLLSSGMAQDATSAFMLLEAVRFANLHVTRVAATIAAQSGIAEGEIAGAHAPARVRTGSLVTLRLTVRRYRGALKTIAVRLRIPRSARGSLVARIYGAAVPPSLLPGGGSGGPGPGPGSGGGGTGPGAGNASPQAPTSLRTLRRMFAQIGHYDGLLVTIRHHVVALYRDPALLIAGSATVRFTVR